MNYKEKNDLLNKIENELIDALNWHKNEKNVNEGFLRKEGYSKHLEYVSAYEDGAINALKDAIDIVRKHYPF